MEETGQENILARLTVEAANASSVGVPNHNRTVLVGYENNEVAYKEQPCPGSGAPPDNAYVDTELVMVKGYCAMACGKGFRWDINSHRWEQE